MPDMINKILTIQTKIVLKEKSRQIQYKEALKLSTLKTMLREVKLETENLQIFKYQANKLQYPQKEEN
jgi:hypothetical protein